MFTLHRILPALASAALLVSATATPPTTGCDTSKSILDVPSGQTAVVAPPTAPLFVTIGVGVQNYTCNSTSKVFTYDPSHHPPLRSIGAVASLFDISCLGGTPDAATIARTAFIVWDHAPANVNAHAIGPVIGTPTLLGEHYFIKGLDGTGLAAKWDFTSTGKFAGNATAFVVASKTGDIPDPFNPKVNVDWLELKRNEGELSWFVFRIDTFGGQPPTSCVPGSPDISVKYAAKYFFY
ncbi:hypothetical protein C8R46DRAFT_1192584 [Mycena filopes]|nr:hypothetical protein C8R46DRAFT_1192584 [Mycena filopes]